LEMDSANLQSLPGSKVSLCVVDVLTTVR